MNSKELELKQTQNAMQVLQRDGAAFQEERKVLLLRNREVEAHSSKKIAILESEVKSSRATISKLKMEMRDDSHTQDETVDGYFTMRIT